MAHVLHTQGESARQHEWHLLGRTYAVPGRGGGVKFGMAKLGARKIWCQLLDTTEKFGTNSSMSQKASAKDDLIVAQQE